MLSKQQEDAERIETMRNDESVRRQQTPVSEAELRERVEELSRKGLRAQQEKPSTYLDHTDVEVPGRHGGTPTTVVGKGKDPWPAGPNYWAAADMGTERSFGKQLHSFDGGSMNTVQEKKP